MKTTALLTISGAALALAGPLNKRVMQVDVVTDVVYVTVTVDPVTSTRSMMAAGNHRHRQSHTTTLEPFTILPINTYSPEAPPPPPPVPTPEVPAPSPEPAAYTPEVQVQAPPSPPAQNIPAAAPSDFASTAVYHHNVHRDNHSSPAISWSDEYAGYAAQTAQKCVFEHDMGPGGGGYGQNLAMYAATGAEGMGASKAVAQAISDLWYNGELPQFPSGSYGQSNPDMSNFSGFGHFTQVIWAGSTQVGCEAHLCRAGTMFPTMDAWFTVCNYFPAGNVGGGYGSNVGAPLGKATVTG